MSLDHTSTIGRRLNGRAFTRPAFSLLELLAVVSILAVLTAAVLPRVSTSAVSAKRKMCQQHQTEINRALERYYLAEGAMLTELTPLNHADYFPDGVPSCPVNSSPYSIDADTHRLKACSCQ